MKVGDRNGVQDPRLTGSKALASGTGAIVGDPEGNPNDQVEVSDVSRALSRLFGAAHAAPATPPQHADRLAALQKAVENATYAPDPAAIARKLLLDELA